MRRYETFVIIDPDLSQEQREPLIGRVEELITQMDGFRVKTDAWGERKLAYDIKKKGRGYYVRFDYCGLAPLVNEIERFFRIDDRALKYMTVLLNRDVDLEKIKEEKAAREAAAAESAAAESAATENPSDPDNAPEEDQIKELAPAAEKAINDEDVPPSETEGSAADKTPPSTKEEA
jgi:small subunit ribosomal protein S6